MLKSIKNTSFTATSMATFEGTLRQYYIYSKKMDSATKNKKENFLILFDKLIEKWDITCVKIVIICKH